jgi:PAS domain S-box-containing protein
MNRTRTILRGVVTAVGAAAALGLLYWMSRENYLLFHSTVELFVVAVAVAVFLIVWNIRELLQNGFLIVVGISALFIAILDLLHTLAYEDMGVFADGGAPLATQLWIAARYTHSLAWLAAALMLGRQIRARAVVGFGTIVTAALVLSIFVWPIFPACYVATGNPPLTPFKIVSEYIISGLFAASLALLYRRRRLLEPKVLRLFGISVVLMILGELAFTLYRNPFGLPNMFGHLLKAAAFYLVYKVIIETGLRSPYQLLFRELKTSQERLEESQERFRLMADFTQDWEYWIDPDGRFLYMSPSCKQITGYDAEEFVRDPDLLKRIIHPEDRDRVEPHLGQEQLPDKQPVSIDLRIIRRDGEERWVNHLCRPVYRDDGQWAGRRASNRDVTNAKQAEEERELFLAQLEIEEAKLEAIINSAPEAIVVADPYGHVTMMNPAAEELYQYRTPFSEHDPDPEAPRLCHANGTPYERHDLPLVRAALDGETQVNLEMALLWPDGRRRDLLHNTAPIRDSHGKVTGAVGIFQDISEQHQFRAELARRAQQLETLVREAHHRIRNNLQSIVALLEVERGRMDVAGQGALDRCISRIRAIAMVHRMLTSQAASDVPLEEMLSGLVELARETNLRAENRSIEIGVTGGRFSVSSKKATHLAIVINELVANAIEHGFEGRAEGRVHVVVTRNDAGQADITVTDNGCGCSPDVAEGTGLLIARSIVENDLGGQFSAEHSDTGCCFRLTFQV